MFKEYLDHYKMRDSFIKAINGVRKLATTDREASLMLQDSLDSFYLHYLKVYNLSYNEEQKEKDFLSVLNA